MITKIIIHNKTAALTQAKPKLSTELSKKRPRYNTPTIDPETKRRKNPKCVGGCGKAKHNEKSTCPYWLWKKSQIELGVVHVRTREDDGRQITKDEWWRQQYMHTFS